MNCCSEPWSQQPARLWTLFWDITIMGQVENGARRHEGIRGTVGITPHILALATRWWVGSAVGTVNGCVDGWYWFTTRQVYMSVSECHCAALSLCHGAIVPQCPFVTVPLWNKRGGGKFLNVYDASGHLVLHSTTVPPAFHCLQLYVKCHIMRSEKRQWFEVTDLQVFESSEQFVRCNPSLCSRRRHSVLYGTCSCVQGCTNPSILVV